MRVAEFETIEGAEVHIDLESIETIIRSPSGATVTTKSGEEFDLDLDMTQILEYAWIGHLEDSG